MKTKKKHLLIILTFFVSFFQFFAQDLSLKWSENMIYQNKRDGYFEKVIGSTDDKILTLFASMEMTGMTHQKIKVVSFDKETLKKTGSIAIKGYKENAADKKNYKGLDYYKTIVLGEKIYIFWIEEINKKNERKENLFVEVINSDLKREGKLKKIFTANFNSEVKKSRGSESSLIVLSNKDIKDRLIVGYEIPSKDDKVSFSYSTLNPDLEIGELKSIVLPIKLTTKKSYGLTSDYTFGSDGNIFIRSNVKLSREEKKELKKGENGSYSIFSIVNPETEEINKFELRKENYNINDFKFIITKDKIKIYGFFCDLEKDPKGNSTHGIFRSEISSDNLEDSGISFTYFDKKVISALFANDKEDLKKTTLKKKKKAKKSGKDNPDDEALDINFGIEQMFVTPEDDVVLFSSKMRNYAVTTCSSTPGGGQTCVTRYYCEKSNVTAIKISNEGDIVWASNLDRKITYSGWDIEDINVVFKNNKYYVIYGSSYNTDDEKKKKKKFSEYRDSFEYAVFDAADGNYVKNTFAVNTKDQDKKTRKSVNPISIQAIDDNFYVDYKKVNPWSYMCCVYVAIINPGAIKADANLGVISILEPEAGSGKKKSKSKAKTKPKPAPKTKK